MNDLAVVCVLNGLGKRSDHFGGHRGVLRSAREVLFQAAAADELHGEVRPPGVFADFVDRHDIGMLHASRGRGLDAKAGPLLRACQRSVANHFDGDEPVR